MNDSSLNSSLTDDNEVDSLLKVKVDFAKRFHQHYRNTILWIISMVIIKRIIMKGGSIHPTEMLIHSSTLAVFYSLSRVYDYSHITVQYMPFVYALISYYAHTVFIFKGMFDSDDDPS